MASAARRVRTRRDHVPPPKQSHGGATRPCRAAAVLSGWPMDRAVAPLLLLRRASGRQASSRLRAPRRRNPVQLRHHRDPRGCHRRRLHPRHHSLPLACRCRMRDRGRGEKRAEPATLIRFRPRGPRCRTQDLVQEQCTALAILFRRCQTMRLTELDRLR